MAEIEEIIDKLLKEPIGHHMLDSGRAYGYIYERNQKEGYLQGLNPVEEYTDEETKERTLEITIPIYDYLKYNLEKDEETVELEKELFEEFKNEGFEPYEIYEVSDWLKSKADETRWLEICSFNDCLNGEFKKGMDRLHSQRRIKECGVCSLDYTNTYNADEYISQTLLYVCFQVDGEDYVLLEVHNGCDVRSGYTYPQLFKIKDIEYFLLGQFDMFCQCECGLNDYWKSGYDDVTDSCGDYIGKEEVYERTYVDEDGNVRCKECNDIIKGGFVEW